MAADYVLPDSVPSTRFERSLKAFITVSVLFLAGVLIWLLGIAPFRSFSEIDVSAYDGMSKEEILAKAGITNDSSYFSTNTQAAEKALMGLVCFESVRVFKHFPDRLQIVIEGRRAVASALASLDGKAVPVLFDSQGIIFQVGSDEKDSSLPSMLPLISGLVIEDPFPGMKLPAIFIPLFKELEKIEISAPELLAAVSELRICPRSFDGFDLILYPVHKRVKVHLSEVNEDLLRYTLLMVDILASKEPGIESLDFRSGIASYVPKEASSE